VYYLVGVIAITSVAGRRPLSHTWFISTFTQLSVINFKNYTVGVYNYVKKKES